MHTNIDDLFIESLPSEAVIEMAVEFTALPSFLTVSAVERYVAFVPVIGDRIMEAPCFVG